MGNELFDFNEFKNNEKIDLKIDSNNIWYYKGEKIEHPKILKYLKSLIGKDEKGFFLANEREKYYITVEDAPLQVNYINISGNEVFINTDSDLEIKMNFENLYLRNDIFYYIHNEIPIKFTRKAQAELLKYAIEEKGEYFLKIGSKKYKIKIDNS